MEETVNAETSLQTLGYLRCVTDDVLRKRGIRKVFGNDAVEYVTLLRLIALRTM